jgi:glucokinase
MPKRDGVIVGVDLGGTSMKALAVDARNNILAVEKTATDRNKKPSDLIADIASVARKAVESAKLEMKQVEAVSVGAPGSIDHNDGIVHEAPNLGWKEIKLGPELKKHLGVPVVVDNDVNVGLVGEHALGAGAGAAFVAGIFVGTGIGGALIADGKLYQGSRGGAGEIGHTVILVDGPLCSCGHRGCAEALASRTAMERDVRAAIQAGQQSVVLKLMAKKEKSRMTSSIIHAALKQDDEVMRNVLERAQRHLGILVANAVNLLDPERVVIGGGIAGRLGEDFVGPIRKTAYEYFLRPDDARRVKILPGQLGDNAGALGAVVLARQRLGL